MDIRNEILKVVEKEIVGPFPNPNYLDAVTGEEILLARVHGSPKSRYGAGMLYPQQDINRGMVDSGEDTNEIVNEEYSDKRELEKNQKTQYNSGDENDEEPVGMANQYLPSAMGFTVRLNGGQNDDRLILSVKSAYYEKGKDKKPIKVLDASGEVLDATDKEGNVLLSDYWIRRPISPDPISLNLNTIFNAGKKSFERIIKINSKGENWLSLRVYNRTTVEDKEEGMLTVTFVLINSLSAETDSNLNSSKILYQNELRLNADNELLIEPYKERVLSSDTEEEKELNLLYRNKRIFSIGHGTSVKWDASENEVIGRETVRQIETCVLPVYELPQVSPTSHVKLSMLELSDHGDWDAAKESLESLRREYSNWVDEIETQVANLTELKNYQEAAKSNIEKCRLSLKRINKGIELLIHADENSDLVKCFRWMNRAMIWQQQRSKAKIRKWRKTGSGKNQTLMLDYLNEKEQSHNFESLEEFHRGKYNGKWRPFQLAFILMNIESIINSKSKERQVVDLIWFPTGGGKTEAYLGLTAFNIFFRRIKGKKDSNWENYGGTIVLMRYTLRLLTTQQYERAASLICACDQIRIENQQDRSLEFKPGELGDESISIGLWVGGASTPNKNDEARAQLKKLKEDSRADYNFVVMKCPCCGAQIGKVDNFFSNSIEKVKGIHSRDGRSGEVYFQCDNTSCEYSNIPLPLQVIDELIYNQPPTLVLGTVDKFAMIPWKKEAGSLFGFRRRNPKQPYRIIPPELIIQDELHLIAGPLGTMVGLYETMVQTLCNDYSLKTPPFLSEENDDFIPPKIVASSATISRSYDQVKSLYAIKQRDQLNIFPSQGLEFGDTWFSEEKPLSKDSKGNQEFPGRKYVGVLASGYPSSQTSIVRTYAMVLQKIKELAALSNPDKVDYYWSLLGYFNSIRELGGASSLVHSDIVERLGQIQNRDLIPRNKKRYLRRIEELTSRISSSQIPAILKKLETNVNFQDNKSLDICLATNMVATGVDISRLGLMFIHGQPKTTAEYIQASSRVGREVPAGPGLIFTLYSPSKPRDKSQYEQFQAYHSRIYSNVEPTSVTPFSINARQRGLHAVLIALIRHFSSDTLFSSPQVTKEFDDLTSIFTKLLLERCNIVDEEEESNTKKLLSKIVTNWKLGGAENYGDAGNYAIMRQDDYYPLMYATSAEVRDEVRSRQTSFATMTSMRGVDTESVLSIYSNNTFDE